MNELVTVQNNEVICTSLDVAERFGKRHDKILHSIDELIVNSETPKKWFQKSFYKVDGNNKSYPMYVMNRDGFSLLVMGFTGKKALEWKIKYIDAFNKMEKLLSEQQTSIWIETRYQGKLTRKAETDVIKQLIEYAKKQGSKHSEMLYITYTKLANKMSGIEKGRDLATVNQLSKLTFIENIILNQIRVGMQKDMDYHQIYKDCKKQIELFKDIAYLETID